MCRTAPPWASSLFWLSDHGPSDHTAEGAFQDILPVLRRIGVGWLDVHLEEAVRACRLLHQHHEFLETGDVIVLKHQLAEIEHRSVLPRWFQKPKYRVMTRGFQASPHGEMPMCRGMDGKAGGGAGVAGIAPPRQVPDAARLARHQLSPRTGPGIPQ